MPSYKLLPQTVAAIASRSKDYWDKQRPELFRLKQCYETRMWDDRMGYDDRNFSPMQGINVEVPVGYETVETLMASLFTRQPGVVIRPGIQGTGSPEKAEALINNWTMRNRRVIEDAARLALIYPMSFVKLAPQDHIDPIRRVTAVAVPPWEVIIDRDAYRWDEQRFCGHVYYLPLPDAKAKFGNKRFEAGERPEYWDKSGLNSEMGYRSGPTKMGVGTPTLDEGEEGYFHFIKVVELYDFINDKLLFWSPNYKSGDEFLDVGPIPFRKFDGSPDNNVIPMYFNHVPDKPLDGYSTLRRTYDQAFEMNIIRSFQANAVRKASRQWLVKKGAMDEEQMAQLISGVDGAYVEVDTDSLDGVMRAVPHTSTPPEVQAYYEAVRSDKDRGSIMAPFTRGEATRSSATEIAALVAYTSSETGRMARERDEMIELMSRGILNMYRVYLGEDPVTLLVKGKYLRVSGSDLYDDFNIYSQDNASTPVSDAIRKSELLGASNLLMAMGVPQQEMLKELVRTLNLPESFLQPAQPPPQEMMGPPQEGNLPSAGPAAAAALKGSGAGSPSNLAAAILDARR
jgi:hypothetical protein